MEAGHQKIAWVRSLLPALIALSCAACGPGQGADPDASAPRPGEQVTEQAAQQAGVPLAAAATPLEAYARRADVLDTLLIDAAGSPGDRGAALAAPLDGLLRELLELAVPVLEQVTAAHPGCTEYFTLVLDARALVDALGPAELARAWVHDGSLPPTPARCQHAQDLLARPAQALSVLNAQGSAGMPRAAELLLPLSTDIAEVARIAGQSPPSADTP